METHPDELESDHVPITCHILGTVLSSHIPKIPLYHKDDWSYIRSWVDRMISNQNLSTIELTPDNYEILLNKITAIIKGASRKIPLGEKVTHERYISAPTLSIIRQRNKFRRKFQRCRDIHRRQTLSAILKHLKDLLITIWIETGIKAGLISFKDYQREEKSFGKLQKH